MLAPCTAERPGNSSGLMPMQASQRKVSCRPSKLTDGEDEGDEGGGAGAERRHGEDLRAGRAGDQREAGRRGAPTRAGAIRATRPKKTVSASPWRSQAGPSRTARAKIASQ